MIRRWGLIPVLAGMLTACSASRGRDAIPDGAHAGSGGALTLRAEEERRGGASAPVAAPIDPPPGVDAGVLAPRAGSHARARLSLEAVMAERAAAVDPSPPPVVAEPDTPAQRDQALRHYLRGRDEAAQGRHLVAVTELEKARTLDGSQPAVLRQLARSLTAVGNPGRAGTVYEELLAIDDDTEARLTLALSALNRRDFDRVLALLAPPWTVGRVFEHDPAAGLLADYALHVALDHLGYDRASIEAGRRAVQITFPLGEQTRYRARVASLYRQRSDIWRVAGDAHCRLGEHGAALGAYARAVELPTADPGGLIARVVYANLCLGRPYTAQQEVVAALRARAPVVTDREVQLCGYVGERSPDRTLLAEALVDLHEAYPDETGFVRAAALVLPVDEASTLLEAFLDRRPRDVAVVSQILHWQAQREPDAALRLTASLSEREPDLADAYVDRFQTALTDPLHVMRDDASPATPGIAGVRARLLAQRSGLAAAWDECGRGLERWPDDAGLRRLRVELAADLDEPPLLDAALDRARGLDDTWSLIVKAAACRETDRFDEAMEYAHAAVAAAAAGSGGRYGIEALLEQARVHVARALPMPIDATRQQEFVAAARLADGARVVDPTVEEPYAFLAGLYGPNGVLADPERFREVITQLRAECGDGRVYARLVVQDAIDRGRYERALERALGLWSGDPADDESLGLAVTAWARLDRDTDAERWLRERLAERPADVQLLERLVRLLLAREATAEARILLEQGQPWYREDPAALGFLEVVEQMDGQVDRAVELGEARLMARPAGTRRALQLASLYRRAERPADADRWFAWLADHADDASRQQLSAAIGLAAREIEATRERAAITARLVERTVERFPDASIPVYTAGLLALIAADAPDTRFEALALAAARRAADAGEVSIRAALPWRDLAQRLIDHGEPGRAASVLRLRLEAGLDGDRPLEAEALALFASMILVSEAAAGADADRSVTLLVDLAERGHVPALPGVEGRPTLAAALSAASQAYTLVGDETGTERLLLESVRRDDGDAMTMNNLGYLRIEQGRCDPETAAWIEAASERSPQEISILDTLAWLRYKQGRFRDSDEGSGAVSILRRVLTMGEEPDPEVLDHYADALWRIGDREEALRTWREVARRLEDTERREQIVRNYRLIQTRVWGLLVADPDEMYDREIGALQERARTKLSEAEAGGDPPVSPTFDEHAGAE